MTNNDILRRLRFIMDYNNSAMAATFALGGLVCSREQIIGWLAKEEDTVFLALEDQALAQFLNGLISSQRGQKEGEQPIAEARLNNNIILRKLKIAFTLRDDDLLALLLLADFRMGKAELSAFFRKPDHPHYRQCQAQVLRNVLKGLQLKLRP
ncbi:DUF1456 family protein [Alishewanella sp. 16-MA]|uniref:DUF1456 family protein n=1 Tax=Alishewanella maricola TaxID=2795740 RepID=A0ABS8C198_9ALTE|nr:DUF1456 family protein [Alishewanella maricola]MCB5225900.1 DUF1456 family protein [Alishewanella maricola]